jgi:hypothetical protein
MLSILLTLILALVPSIPPPPAASQPGNLTFQVTKLLCPPGYDPGSVSAGQAFGDCASPGGGWEFQIQTFDGNYFNAATTDGNGFAGWSDIPGGVGFSVSEVMPEGQPDPWVHCYYSASATGASDIESYQPASGGIISIGDPALLDYAQVTCTWFNASGGGQSSGLTIDKISCVGTEILDDIVQSFLEGGFHEQCSTGTPDIGFVVEGGFQAQGTLDHQQGRVVFGGYAGQAIDIRELPAESTNHHQFQQWPMCGVVVDGAFTPTDTGGPLEPGMPFQWAPSAAGEYACLWINLYEPGITNVKYTCAPEVSPEASLQELEQQCSPTDGHEFRVSGPAGDLGSGGSPYTLTGPEFTTPDGVAIGIAESIPSTNSGVRVFCSGARGGYQEISPDQIAIEGGTASLGLYIDPNGYQACVWFNMGAAGDGGDESQPDSTGVENQDEQTGEESQTTETEQDTESQGETSSDLPEEETSDQEGGDSIFSQPEDEPDAGGQISILKYWCDSSLPADGAGYQEWANAGCVQGTQSAVFYTASDDGSVSEQASTDAAGAATVDFGPGLIRLYEVAVPGYRAAFAYCGSEATLLYSEADQGQLAASDPITPGIELGDLSSYSEVTCYWFNAVDESAPPAEDVGEIEGDTESEDETASDLPGEEASDQEGEDAIVPQESGDESGAVGQISVLKYWCDGSLPAAGAGYQDWANAGCTQGSQSAVFYTASDDGSVSEQASTDSSGAAIVDFGPGLIRLYEVAVPDYRAAFAYCGSQTTLLYSESEQGQLAASEPVTPGIELGDLSAYPQVTCYWFNAAEEPAQPAGEGSESESQEATEGEEGGVPEESGEISLSGAIPGFAGPTLAGIAPENDGAGVSSIAILEFRCPPGLPVPDGVDASFFGLNCPSFNSFPATTFKIEQGGQVVAEAELSSGFMFATGVPSTASVIRRAEKPFFAAPRVFCSQITFTDEGSSTSPMTEIPVENWAFAITPAPGGVVQCQWFDRPEAEPSTDPVRVLIHARICTTAELDAISDDLGDLTSMEPLVIQLLDQCKRREGLSFKITGGTGIAETVATGELSLVEVTNMARGLIRVEFMPPAGIEKGFTLCAAKPTGVAIQFADFLLTLRDFERDDSLFYNLVGGFSLECIWVAADPTEPTPTPTPTATPTITPTATATPTVTPVPPQAPPPPPPPPAQPTPTPTRTGSIFQPSGPTPTRAPGNIFGAGGPSPTPTVAGVTTLAVQPGIQPPGAAVISTPATGQSQTAVLILSVANCDAGYDVYAEDADPAKDCDEPGDDLEFTLGGPEPGMERTGISGAVTEGSMTFAPLEAGNYLLGMRLPQATDAAFISGCSSNRRAIFADNPFAPFAYASPSGQIGVSLVAGETLECSWYNVPTPLVTVLAFDCPAGQINVATCKPSVDGLTITFASVDPFGIDYSVTTDTEGVAHADLRPDTYEMEELPASVCFVDSKGFDQAGNLVVEEGTPIEVSIFTCGLQPLPGN